MPGGVHDNDNTSARYEGRSCKCFFGIRLKTEREIDNEADQGKIPAVDDPLLVSLADMGWNDQDVTVDVVM